MHHHPLQPLRRGGRGEGAPRSTPAAASSGATSPDGRFTVIEVECLGACGFATPILVDDDFIENVTPEKVPGIRAEVRVMGYPHPSHPKETVVLSKHFGDPEARTLRRAG